MKRLGVAIFLIFNLLGGSAYASNSVDSLNVLLGKASKKEKIPLLKTLINYYEKSNNDSALALLDKGILLSQELKNIESEYTFKIKKTGIFIAKGKYNDAIEMAELVVMEISSLSTISFEKKNTLTYDAYNFIGIANANMGNYSNALYYYQKNVELAKLLKKEISLAIAYTNIGLMYYNLYEDDKAISYYTKAKVLYEKNNNEEGLSGIALNIGTLYHEQGNLQKALDSYFYSLKIETRLKDKKGQSFAINNIADVYRLQKKYDKALEYNQKNLRITEELGNVQSSIYSYNNLADLYKELNQFDNAREYAQKSYKLAEKHQLPLLVINSLQVLSEIAENQNNFKEALAFQKLMLLAKDSLNEKNKSKTLLELEAKYQNEQNQKDIQLKNAEIAAKKTEVENKKLQTNALMGGIILVMLLAIFILRSYNQKKKINIKLEAINDELEKLSVVARETDNVVIIADSTGNIEWINESYTKLYGYTIEEFKEKFGKSILTGSSNPKINSVIQKCMDEKISVKYILNNTTKTGENKWVQTTMTPVLNSEGAIEKFILIDTDITKLQEAQFEIENQSKLLEVKNGQIMDSIDYAKRIQSAVFPSNQLLQELLPNHFIFFKPKDIVSGDFYWARQSGDELLFAVADCTGHGVPGAFMSIISINILNNIANLGETDPAKILVQLGERLVNNLNLNHTTESIKDGLDIALCCYNKNTRLLQYAGAHNSLYLVRDNELTEYKADKIHIGKTDVLHQEFTSHQISIKKDDMVYLFTDGYVDQKGGDKGKKFYYPPFRDLLLSNYHKPMLEQEQLLENTIATWMKNTAQIDDICVMGIKF